MLPNPSLMKTSYFSKQISTRNSAVKGQVFEELKKKKIKRERRKEIGLV